MKIPVSPMFAEPLAEINKILIAWEEHKLTEGEAQMRFNDILKDIIDAKASVMQVTALEKITVLHSLWEGAFAVIQKDVCVFGSGLTAEEAVKNAKEWMDKDCEEQEWEVDDFDDFYRASAHEMMLVPCTKKLYDLIQLQGGDALFVVDQGLAQTWEEFEGGE